MAFPTQDFKSDIIPISETVMDRSDGGTPRGQRLADADTYRINITWPIVSATQLTAIRSAWNTSGHSEVTVTANDGEDYTGIWRQEPRVTPLSGLVNRVTTYIEGTRD